ncbi:MAG TPA: dTMP kinase [Candidatus Omnitrophota bacterium]|nr:dTMP kinase [Candidatus Omnitrophota bacterium]
MKHKGLFITFEGPEGSGKSTLIRFAQRYFRRRGISVLLLREPGGTPVSEKIREILLHEKGHVSEESELLLYLAARAELMKEKIFPAIEKGMVVLCDRFHDSTRAYQGYGLGISLRLIDEIGTFVKKGIEPDLTILLDTDVGNGLRRAGRGDRIEKRSVAFHQRVRRGFLDLARKNPDRIKILGEEPNIRIKEKKLGALLDIFLRAKG